MELIHCRSESCWLQNAGPSQREGTLPAANPPEILREGRTMEPETSTEEPLQPQWHVYMGQELGQQPARAGTAQGSELPLRCPCCPAEVQHREPQQCLTSVTDPAANTASGALLQHQHSCTACSKQGAASPDSCVPCPQLFRKKLYLVLIRNTSQHTRPFLKEVSLKGNTPKYKSTQLQPAPFFRGSKLTGKGRNPSTC